MFSYSDCQILNNEIITASPVPPPHPPSSYASILEQMRNARSWIFYDKSKCMQLALKSRSLSQLIQKFLPALESACSYLRECLGWHTLHMSKVLFILMMILRTKWTAMRHEKSLNNWQIGLHIDKLVCFSLRWFQVEKGYIVQPVFAGDKTE